ncbi:hypothetical protein DPMN_035176 [Dreissena polymorpha]|uniref:Uncharacterized protein n=1 Tax=Dreissena polymorpha TaxID=45954 RepID=A0A9D4MBE6_DREPO|nr:hypothetical protein DPMN_035176 [Dreissena polymorpha]
MCNAYTQYGTPDSLKLQTASSMSLLNAGSICSTGRYDSDMIFLKNWYLSPAVGKRF